MILVTLAISRIKYETFSSAKRRLIKKKRGPSITIIIIINIITSEIPALAKWTPTEVDVLSLWPFRREFCRVLYLMAERGQSSSTRFKISPGRGGCDLSQPAFLKEYIRYDECMILRRVLLYAGFIWKWKCFDVYIKDGRMVSLRERGWNLTRT